MTIAFTALILGCLLIYLEFYLPGGILGTAGAVFALSSVFFFTSASSSLVAASGFFFLTVLSIVGTCKFALRQIEKKKEGGVYLESDQEGFRAPSFDVSLVGKPAKALSPLNPSGYVEVDGKRHQAVAKVGYVEKGADLEVIGGEGGHLVVIEKLRG